MVNISALKHLIHPVGSDILKFLFSDEWIVLDISPPDLAGVRIYGTLEFDPDPADDGSYKTLKLSAMHILVFGRCVCS